MFIKDKYDLIESNIDYRKKKIFDKLKSIL